MKEAREQLLLTIDGDMPNSGWMVSELLAVDLDCIQAMVQLQHVDENHFKKFDGYSGPSVN